MTRSLQTLDIRKEYPGTVALDGVSLTFEGGRVTALLGKNGAGKSTLVKILAGTVQPTRGQILVDGQPVELRSATDAFEKGIATVYQELSLVPGLTVAENILLGRMPRRRGALGRVMIDWRAATAQAKAILREMGVELDPGRKVSELGVAQQQIVEIAKAMSFNPSVLMLDEPTSALARHETELLFKLVGRLAARGVAIVYITHRLQELKQIADVAAVLRDGRLVGTVEMAQATPEAIVRMMFGEVARRCRPADLKPAAETSLEVRGLTQAGRFRDVNFTLRRGEVLGIAGMIGAGRTELLRAIFGAEPCDRGEIFLEGRPVDAASPQAMKNHGLALVPEDRKQQALVLGLSIRANLCLAGMSRLATGGFITRRRERALTESMTQRLEIKAGDSENPVESLSGGNQQKVVVGKWLGTRPRVMLFDEPTRGIDVQAKQQIFQIMWDLSREGIASIFVSSELEELLAVCHRILIMKGGTIAGEVEPEAVTPDELVLACMEE